MTGKIFYLDTNICIFHLRNPFGTLATKIYSFSSDRIKLPAIVKAELLVGAVKSAKPEQNIAEIEAFCRPFEIIPFEDSMADTYARMRATLELRGQKIGYNDLIIAATALQRKGVSVTNNVREFSRIDGIMIEDWNQ